EAGVGNICTQGALSKRGTSCTMNSACASPWTANGDCFSGGGVGTCLGGTCTTAVCSFEKCTNAGCLFGQPLPIPNPASTPTSVCVINVVAANASGTADCSSGASAISLPLTSQLYLVGDLEPTAPGIQVCPVCTFTCNTGSNANGPCTVDADCGGTAGSCVGPNVCHGGPSYPHVACTPDDSPQTKSFPTTHGCPPALGLSIGSIPIAFALTTGTTSLTAGDYSANAQCTASAPSATAGAPRSIPPGSAAPRPAPEHATRTRTLSAVSLVSPPSVARTGTPRHRRTARGPGPTASSGTPEPLVRPAAASKRSP